MKRLLLVSFTLCCLAAGGWARPLVIAHRGASGYLPEHTLEAYELAVEQGADYVEPDLVPTKDGYLVSRHENNISETTNVAEIPAFAARKTRKTIDGHSVEGWFTEDFTLAELRQLRARGRNRASREYNDRYAIPTFGEVIALVRRLEKKTGKTIGICPEIKHSSYFRSLGLGLEEPTIKLLHEAGYKGAEAPVFIQSFEVGNLKRLRSLSQLRLTQLVDTEGAPQDWVQAGSTKTYADMLTPEGLREVASYAAVLAPHKSLVIGRDAQGMMGTPTDLLRKAHAAGLQVHCWTFRAENAHLPPDLRVGADPDADGDLSEEVHRFFQAGLDGVFSNHPDQAVQALSRE